MFALGWMKTISNLGSHYVLYLQEVPKAGPTESIGFVDSHRDQRRINKQLCKESLRGGESGKSFRYLSRLIPMEVRSTLQSVMIQEKTQQLKLNSTRLGRFRGIHATPLSTKMDIFCWAWKCKLLKMGFKVHVYVYDMYMTVPVIVINILHCCLYSSRWRDNHRSTTMKCFTAA